MARHPVPPLAGLGGGRSPWTQPGLQGRGVLLGHTLWGLLLPWLGDKKPDAPKWVRWEASEDTESASETTPCHSGMLSGRQWPRESSQWDSVQSVLTVFCPRGLPGSLRALGRGAAGCPGPAGTDSSGWEEVSLQCAALRVQKAGPDDRDLCMPRFVHLESEHSDSPLLGGVETGVTRDLETAAVQGPPGTRTGRAWAGDRGHCHCERADTPWCLRSRGLSRNP